MKLIDGTELKKHIESTICYGCEIGHVVTPCGRCFVSDLLRYIDEMQEVDAQPVKRAKWVKYPSIYRCSNCGNPKGMPKPYCELCGARMSDHFANAGKMVEEASEDEQTQ